MLLEKFKVIENVCVITREIGFLTEICRGCYWEAKKYQVDISEETYVEGKSKILVISDLITFYCGLVSIAGKRVLITGESVSIGQTIASGFK